MGNSQDWTPAPWDQTAEAVVDSQSNVIATTTDSDFSADKDDAHLRRIVAAVNATKDFDTAALESVFNKGQTLRLALLASTMLESPDVLTAEGIEKWWRRANAAGQNSR